MGTSTSNVCSPFGDERQAGCLPGFSPMKCLAVLQTLLKEGALGTNIPKLSAFSGEMAKGEVSFEQWSYELQMLCKSYSHLALREAIQHSLRGAAADTVCNMGPNILLDMILKKFTIIYGNVKSFNLLMRDFYRADQGDDETIPSFATRIEGLLSQIRDRFPNQLPHQEEQRLLKDCLFHGSRKGIHDSVKYCSVDASIDYMHFLEEQVSLVRATQPSSSVARTGNLSYGRGGYGKKSQGTGEEVLGERASPHSQEPLFSLKSGAPNKSRGLLKPTSQTSAGSLGRWGI